LFGTTAQIEPGGRGSSRPAASAVQYRGSPDHRAKSVRLARLIQLDGFSLFKERAGVAPAAARTFCVGAVRHGGFYRANGNLQHILFY
jgi:hypothetical protein